MARIIPKQTLDDIRFRCDIADTIGSYLTLKRAGSGFKGLCPFHKEKTPSFHVNPQRQIFHCFGCGAGGDVFSFIMQHEGMDFTGAAQMLAARAGVVLELEDGDGDGQDKNVLYKLNSLAAAFYHRTLQDGKSAVVARDYLKKRALSDETIGEFQLGYAPNQWDAVLKGAQKKKYKRDQIEAAGLILKSSKPGSKDYYDRFRNRLMFPIWDEQGRVIGFSGRSLDDKDKTAKYVNSPETRLFKKSRVLYGLDKARKNIVDCREAIVCEGQIDVIRCHQSGFATAVASQGTAFTEEHARILQRYADSICLAFDSDKAGQDASIRAISTFLETGLAVRVVRLPENEDTDSYIRDKGPDAFKRLLEQADSAVGYLVSVLGARENMESEVGTMRITRVVLETIAHSPNAVQRAKLVQEAGQLLNLPPSALLDDLKRLMARQSRRDQWSKDRRQTTDDRGDVVPGQPGAKVPTEHPKEEVALCEAAVRVADFPEIGSLIGQYLPLDMISDPVCRLIVESSLKAAQKGAAIEEVLRDREEFSGELQRFASQVFMAPTKVQGRETSHADAVKDIICFIWKRKFLEERNQLGPDDSERRAQLTYDLNALKNWEDGSAIIEIAMEG